MQSFRIPFRVLASLATVAALASSCTKQQAANQTETSTPPQATATAPVPSDAEIADIVLAANDADIANGRLAKSKSGNADIKSFADMMITDHTSVNDKAKSLASQLGLSPQESATSQSIRSQQDSVRTALSSQSGTGFDKAYIDNEVAYHEQVLNAIDQTLIPNAQNAQLKQLLTDTRPAIAQHLQHARDLQSKLGGVAHP